MTSRDIAVAATTAAGMYVLAQQIPIGPSMSAVGTEFEIDQLPELPENWPFTIKDAQILFAGPNAEEQKEDIEVEIVDGKLPKELKGTYYLNGPGLLHFTAKDGTRTTKHPFDGHGFIRKFTFNGENVKYKGKYVKTAEYKEETEAGRMIYRGIGSNPYPGHDLGALRNAVFSKMQGGGPANTCVLEYSDKLFALWEGGPPHIMNPDTLETISDEPFTFNGEIPEGSIQFLAHTRVDQVSNHLLGCNASYTYNSGVVQKYTMYEFNEKFEKIHESKFTSDDMYFIHDFVFTPNYYVLMLNPAALQWTNLLKIGLGFQPLMKALGQNNDNKMKAVFIPRKSNTKVSKPVMIPVSNSLFSFHHATAYEEDDSDSVTVVTSAFDSYSLGHEFGFASDSNVFDPRRTPENTKPAKECLYKFKFSISQKECTEQKILLDSTPVDFLSVNQLMEGQKNGKPSFVYAASASYTSEGAPPFDQILKVDIENGVDGKWQCGLHRFVGEPIFIPNMKKNEKDGFKEDHGWVISAVYDAVAKTTFLVLLDAEDMNSGPICTIDLKRHLPYGFHGSWKMPKEAQLKQNMTCNSLAKL